MTDSAEFLESEERRVFSHLGGCLSLLDGGTKSTDNLSYFDGLPNESFEVLLIQIAHV